jgi:hypothetical protein
MFRVAFCWYACPERLLNGVVPHEVGDTVQGWFSAVFAVDGFGGAQTPEVIEEFVASIILAMKGSNPKKH